MEEKKGNILDLTNLGNRGPSEDSFTPSSAVRPIGILDEPGEDSAFKDLLRITGMTQGNDRTFTDSSGLAMSLPSSTSAANARSGEFANRSSDSSKNEVRLIDDRRQTQLLHQQHHREPLSEQQEFEQKQVWDSQQDQWWDDQQLTQLCEDQHQQEQEQNSNVALEPGPNSDQQYW
jgi:hypothetical protein